MNFFKSQNKNILLCLKKQPSSVLSNLYANVSQAKQVIFLFTKKRKNIDVIHLFFFQSCRGKNPKDPIGKAIKYP